MFGFYRIATCTPVVRVGDVPFNVEQILSQCEEARQGGAVVALFPELSLTSSRCGDLFYSSSLLDAAESGLATLCDRLPEGLVVAVGLPVRWNGRLLDCAAVLSRGEILGMVPKSWLKNRRESSESRWFGTGFAVTGGELDVAGQDCIPMGTDLLFSFGKDLVLGLELGDDLSGIMPPSTTMCLGGATLIANLASSCELVGAGEYRRNLVRDQSSRCTCAYAYVSSGVHESTTDLVNGGHQLVAENGVMLLDSQRFLRNGLVSLTDVDVDTVRQLRLSDGLFGEGLERMAIPEFRVIPGLEVEGVEESIREFERHPFVPEDASVLASRCEEISSIQVAGLCKRVEHIHAGKLVLGISGGLDSTLALLVCHKALAVMGRPSTDLVAVTMPGFGTTGRTYNNSCGLCRELGAELREISIKDACLEHFRNIGHEESNHNVVYENTQARERTQILLDLANGMNGLAIGTGDLSESAMGWCTYNGDHISMYGVNGSVPKTLLKHVISWLGQELSEQAQAILADIIDTPVSPELLPADSAGQIKQKTEDIIGPYEVHDFFLYHFLRHGTSPDKILWMAEQAFAGEFAPEKLKTFLQGFLRRFFTQQFKRSCMPDGPKVGTVGFSPRGDWRMPSDGCADVWKATLD